MDLDALASSYNITYPGPKLEDHFPPIFATYHHVPILIVVYLSWATVFGPKMMSSRKPLNLKGLICIYNLFQILINAYLFYMGLSMWGYGILHVWDNVCNAFENTIGYGEDVQYGHLKLMFYYYLTKILDFMDTVFFILRKKQSQVTILHLFHHSSMLLSIWLSMVPIREQIGCLWIMLNMLVHVFMYTYYFLSAFGPRIQKYLWWKKHLTKVQMVQFLIMLATLVKMKIVGCKLVPMFWMLWGINLITFIVLFMQFYIKSFRKEKKML